MDNKKRRAVGSLFSPFFFFGAGDTRLSARKGLSLPLQPSQKKARKNVNPPPHSYILSQREKGGSSLADNNNGRLFCVLGTPQVAVVVAGAAARLKRPKVFFFLYSLVTVPFFCQLADRG